VSLALPCSRATGRQILRFFRRKQYPHFHATISFALALCSLLALNSRSAAADAVNTSTNEFIPDLPKAWLREFAVRGSVGYKDNLLLDSSASEHSISFGSGVDVTVARLPLDGRQLNFLLSFDDTRYPDGRKVDHEDLLLGLAQVKTDLGSHWRFGVDGRYTLQNQVVDTSVTETSPEAQLVQGHSLALLPNVRWMSDGNTWVELSGTAQRAFYREPLDDFWEGGPKLSLGLDYGHYSTVSLSYSSNLRAYDTREQTSLSQTNSSMSQTNIPGTSLRFRQHEVEAALRHNWDKERRWRTVTRLGLQVSRDNGPGFYDYDRWYAAQQIRYVAKTWEVRTQGKISYYAFLHQTATDLDQDERRKTLVGADVRGEKQVWRGLKLFATYEYEQSVANRPVDQYQVNIVAGGVIWEF
jgi:hypothetical protein